MRPVPCDMSCSFLLLWTNGIIGKWGVSLSSRWAHVCFTTSIWSLAQAVHSVRCKFQTGEACARQVQCSAVLGLSSRAAAAVTYACWLRLAKPSAVNFSPLVTKRETPTSSFFASIRQAGTGQFSHDTITAPTSAMNTFKIHDTVIVYQIDKHTRHCVLESRKTSQSWLEYS